MQRQIINQPAAVSTGLYCLIRAMPTQAIPVTPGVVGYLQDSVISGSFYANANASATGGVIQPVILNSDGNWRAYGAATTITAAGFLFLTSLVTPVAGIGIQIITTVTGSSVFLECIALLA